MVKLCFCVEFFDSFVPQVAELDVQIAALGIDGQVARIVAALRDGGGVEHGRSGARDDFNRRSNVRLPLVTTYDFTTYYCMIHNFFLLSFI